MTLAFQLVFGSLVFALGTVIGSFLNVCIYRIPWQKSVIWPGSRCPSCLAAIPPRDNVPILSWLVLHGRCRHCGGAISARYPLVEFLVGLLFVGVYLVDVVFGPTDLLSSGALTRALLRMAYHQAFVAFLVAVTFIDYDLYIIPDQLTLPGMVLGLVVGTLVPDVRLDTRTPPVSRLSHGEGFWIGVLGLLVGGATIWAIRILGGVLFRREAMGFGDVTLMAMIGSFLGWQSVPLTIFLGALLALTHALVKVASIVRKWLERRPLTGADREVPFGPYLSMAATILMLGWPWIWTNWAADYFRTLRMVFWYVVGQES